MADADPIDVTEVRKVARLARLQLSDAEVLRMQHDLSSILEYVAKLDELDTDDVPPTAHAVELRTKLRADAVHQGLTTETSLKNAPERLGDGFGVPKIIE